jgi:carbonic anhydrase
VLQYAVDVLKVEHVLVVGHYGCGGVRAAVESTDHGLIDHWLSPVRDTAHDHARELAELDAGQRLDRLCELNVIRQVRNVASNPFVTRAWKDGRSVCIHGWVYSLADGLVHDLDVTVGGPEDFERLFAAG